MKNNVVSLVAGSVLALSTTMASAEVAKPQAPHEASILFANHGGILNWQGGAEQGLQREQLGNSHG